MISVVIPALNEQDNLKDAVKSVIRSSQSAGNIEIEIIIINDGSKDRTAAVADELAQEHGFVRVVHHAVNEGFGSCFLDGLRLAKYEKITLFPGDNGNSEFTTTQLLKNAHKADLIASYILNVETRSRARFVLSALYTLIYQATFDVYIRYMNGTPVYSVAQLRKLKLFSQRYSLFAEINIKLLRSGVTYYEVPSTLNEAVAKSSAIKFKNLVEVFRCFLRLVYEIHVKHRKQFSVRSKRVIPET